MNTCRTPSSTPKWSASTLCLGLLGISVACFPSTEELLGPYFSGRIEVVTGSTQGDGPLSINPKQPVVFRWQPRSHQPLTTMPEAYIVSLAADSNRGVPLKARVEQQGPFLEVTVPAGAKWMTTGGPLHFGVAMGLGHGEDIKEQITNTSLVYKPGQGALMTCDDLKHDWALCWLSGSFELSPPS